MSNKITVSHGELGSIVAEPCNEINKQKKYMIKSLAFLQLVCMTPDSQEDENFPEFMQIMAKATADVRLLYNGEECESTSIEQF